jgi:hypothetical protein
LAAAIYKAANKPEKKKAVAKVKKKTGPKVKSLAAKAG